MTSPTPIEELVRHAYETVGPRYEALALALMEAPDLGRAIASLLGDHEARLDILGERVRHLECQLGEGQVKPHGR